MRMTITFWTNQDRDDMPPLAGLGRVVAGGFYKHVAPDGAMETACTRDDREGPRKLRQERHVYRNSTAELNKLR